MENSIYKQQKEPIHDKMKFWTESLLSSV